MQNRNEEMLRVGVTGSIGSGKSTVCRLFSELGVPVYYADVEAKKMYSCPEVLEEVVNAFGQKMLHNGIINLKVLAALVFSEPDALEQLNSIIHPRLKEDFLKWSEKQNAPYCIQEAAILFESNFHTLFDHTLMVSCPYEERLRRVMLRDGATEEEFMLRNQSQWPEEKKIALADYQIVNDGKNAILPVVLELNRIFKDKRDSYV